MSELLELIFHRNIWNQVFLKTFFKKFTSQSILNLIFLKQKNNCYQSFSINGIKLNQQDDSGNDSDNSYAALDEQSLDDMKTEEEEGSPTPPRKKLKIKDVPIMYTEIMASNFLYHTTKYINLPVCLPKIPNLPFHSLLWTNIF